MLANDTVLWLGIASFRVLSNLSQVQEAAAEVMRIVRIAARYRETIQCVDNFGVKSTSRGLVQRRN